jgi:uncharacterized membrane protein
MLSELLLICTAGLTVWMLLVLFVIRTRDDGGKGTKYILASDIVMLASVGVYSLTAPFIFVFLSKSYLLLNLYMILCLVGGVLYTKRMDKQGAYPTALFYEKDVTGKYVYSPVKSKPILWFISKTYGRKKKQW